MPALRDDIDPDGLLEYSVVFTDRSLNSMSAAFVSVMQDISAMMKEVYQAHSLAVVPGGGTYGMEAIARQFADDADCLVIRNGWFSYRWSQIFEACGMVKSVEILAARQIAAGPQAPFAPVPIEEAEAKIAELKPGVVFCPHVETSAGLMLPDAYITRLAAAVQDAQNLVRWRWDEARRDVTQPENPYEYPQGSACFIQSVQDNMEDIMDLARSEAMLFKFGSGTGTDLSTLRSEKEKLSGGGKPSGPLSFMRVYDQIAAVVKSGGKTRRAAKMQSLKVFHPDIMDFIECKTKEEKKAQEAF